MHISQGSVATRLRCGGKYKHEFVAVVGKKSLKLWARVWCLVF